MAKNLTLALDDRLIDRAREYARARDLTLNSLIRHLLQETVDPPAAMGPEDTFRLMDVAQPEPSQGKWRRESLYESRLR